MRVFRIIKNWFRVNFNKYHFRLVWFSIFTWPWDEYYYLKLNKLRYLEMAHYFEKCGISEGGHRNAEVLKLLARLIDIINEEGVNLYEYKSCGEMKTQKGKDGINRLILPKMEYNCLISVNMHNLSRFADNEYEAKYMKEMPHELYQRKAERLYFKILAQYLHQLWN